MELAPGIHALELGYERGGEELTIHPVAVETRRGLMLIDAGLPESHGQIETQLAAIDHSLEDIVRVLVTHQDADHAGALQEVLNRTGAETLAHLEDAPYIDGRKLPIKSEGSHRYPPGPIDLGVVGGERLRTKAGPARLIHTPGHTPGHLAVYFPRDKLLLAADALVVSEGELAGPDPRHTPRLQKAYGSLQRLVALDIELVHCFHGGSIEADEETIAAIARQGPPKPVKGEP